MPIHILRIYIHHKYINQPTPNILSWLRKGNTCNAQENLIEKVTTPYNTKPCLAPPSPLSFVPISLFAACSDFLGLPIKEVWEHSCASNIFNRWGARGKSIIATDSLYLSTCPWQYVLCALCDKIFTQTWCKMHDNYKPEKHDVAKPDLEMGVYIIFACFCLTKLLETSLVYYLCICCITNY